MDFNSIYNQISTIDKMIDSANQEMLDLDKCLPPFFEEERKMINDVMTSLNDIRGLIKNWPSDYESQSRPQE